MGTQKDMNRMSTDELIIQLLKLAGGIVGLIFLYLIYKKI